MGTTLEKNPIIPELICYNWMPAISDHVLDLPEEQYQLAGTSRLHNINEFNPYYVRDNDLIFVKTDFIANGLFADKYLSKIPPNRIFNLITGVSSYHLGRDGGESYKRVLDHPGLKKWICTNPPKENSEKIIPIPIGFQEGDRLGGNQEFLRKIRSNRKPFDHKENKVFLPWHEPSTNHKRQKMIEELKKLPFVVSQESKQKLEDYYESMNKYKFIIGLEGRGPDIHRNYESMLIGSIPINIRNIIESVFVFHDATAVFLDSWNELDEAMFNKMCSEMYNTSVNDEFLLVKNHITKIKKILGK
jgi:hypothetical protein